MTLVAVPKFIVPFSTGGNASWGFAADVLIDASGEKIAYIVTAPKTGTLKRFEFLLQNVAQAPASGLRLSFQNLDASGNPDGTQDQFRDVTSGIVTDAWIQPGIMTSDGTDTGSKRSVTVGEYIACVIEFVSFSAGDSIEGRALALDTPLGSASGAVALFTASWAKQNAFVPIIALQYDDDTYPFGSGGIPIKTIPQLNINTGTTPDEVALRFRFPVEVAISGYAWCFNPAGAGRDYDIVLYDDASNVIETHSYDADFTFISVVVVGRNFATERVIPANTTYRLALKPTTASSIAATSMTVHDAAHFNAHHGGPEFYWSERANAGAWTDTTTRRPEAYLIVSKVHDGSGGGGGGGPLVGGRLAA